VDRLQRFASEDVRDVGHSLVGRVCAPVERLEPLGSVALDMERHIEVKYEKHQAVCAVDDALISRRVGQPALHR